MNSVKHIQQHNQNKERINANVAVDFFGKPESERRQLLQFGCFQLTRERDPWNFIFYAMNFELGKSMSKVTAVSRSHKHARKILNLGQDFPVPQIAENSNKWCEFHLPDDEIFKIRRFRDTLLDSRSRKFDQKRPNMEFIHCSAKLSENLGRFRIKSAYSNEMSNCFNFYRGIKIVRTPCFEFCALCWVLAKFFSVTAT